MRQLTIAKNFQEYQFNLLSVKLKADLPLLLFELLENYSGLAIEEYQFNDVINDLKWQIDSFCEFSYIYNYLDEIAEEKLSKKLLPFALEEGGWLFCISTEQNSPVYIFKTSDYSGEDAIQKICSSLEEFIDGLQPEEE